MVTRSGRGSAQPSASQRDSRIQVLPNIERNEAEAPLTPQFKVW